MKIRTIGAVLLGTAMLGATLAGAVASADAPQKSFWIDQETGQPNVVIAVGAQANASDVVSASIIGAMVGNMAMVEEVKTVTKTGSVEFDYMGEYNYSYTPNYETYGVGDRPAKWYVDFELFSNGLWETAYDTEPLEKYDITVAIAMPKDVKNPDGDTVAKGLSTLWFSNTNKEWDSKDRLYKFSVTAGSSQTAKKYWLVNEQANDSPTEPIILDLPAYAGGSYDDGDGTWDFDTYGFFTTKAWVDVNGNKTYNLEDDCDYQFGGTGTAMETHEAIRVIPADAKEEDEYDGKMDLLGDKGYSSGVTYGVYEIRYPLLENGQNICGISKCDGMIDFETAVNGYFRDIVFLGNTLTPLFAGATYATDADEYLGAYFVYGHPYAEKERILKVGDVYNFHGWNVTLNDVNIYENKAYVTVTGPTLTAPFSFIMVMDSLGACGPCCPECATYGGGGAFTSNPTNRNEFDPYVVKSGETKDVDGYDYDLFKYVNFMLDGIKTFVGADGTYLAEFNLYALEDFGHWTDKGCCDPFVTTPNDYGMTIYGGWRQVAFDPEDEDEVEIENDTKIIKAGWVSIEDTNSDYLDTQRTDSLPNAYVLWDPEPRYITETMSACPDANFDSIELQLCDKITIPDCETTYTLNGPENYFTIEIKDIDFGVNNSTVTKEFVKRDGIYAEYGETDDTEVTFGHVKGEDKDGVKIRISQTVLDPTQTITYTHSVSIDPIELIKLDIEINTQTNTKNLVLVGGPVYNGVVKDLVTIGQSNVNWATSPGEWEFIEDPYGKGYDVLIVAGANREETRIASQELVDLM